MKYFKVIIITLCCVILAGCAGKSGSSSASDEEKLLDSVEGFEIMDYKVCAISHGKVLYWEDGQWKSHPFETGKKIVEIYEGEHFCAMDEDGMVVWDGDGVDPGYLSLSGAAYWKAAQKLVDFNKMSPFRTIAYNLPGVYTIALCKDGRLIIADIWSNYEPVEIPFDKEIQDVEGGYILTKNGEVYAQKDNGTDHIYSELVSGKKVKGFSKGRYNKISICEDGTVDALYTQGMDFSEWKDIISAAGGVGGCAGLSRDGDVYFVGRDPAKEAGAQEWLKGKKAVAIACAYNWLAILKEDMSVEIFELSSMEEVEAIPDWR